MSDEADLPPDLEELDRALRGVSFRPRESLGPELLGRLRQGEPSKDGPRRRRPTVTAVAASVVLLIGAGLLLHAPGSVVVDRCCYDLDGGGRADDGVLIMAEPDAKVHQLRIYEDLDGSGVFSPADLIRLDRGGSLALHELSAEGLVTVEHCCLDFDGGGPADDGLLVIGVPPDRVVMAAIYERPASPAGERGRHGGFPLR